MLLLWLLVPSAVPLAVPSAVPLAVSLAVPLVVLPGFYTDLSSS